MLDPFMIFSAKYLHLIVVAASLWFMAKNFNKRIFIYSLIYLPLVFIIAKILSLFFYNPRPFVVGHFTPLIYHAVNNGFPSDHSLISFAFASIVLLLNRKLGLVLFLLSFLIGISRVYVGVHHPIDILGSFLICIIVTTVYATIASWKK